MALVAVSACRTGATVPPGFQGIVEYDTRVFGFETGGRVESVAAQRGARVPAGAVLAKLDDVLARLELDARRAEADAAQADLALLLAGTRPEEIAAQAAETRAAGAALELSRKSAARTRLLLASAALPQSESDRAESELARAESTHRAMQERLGALRHGARAEQVAGARAHVAEASAAVALQDQRLRRFTLTADEAGEVIDVHVDPGEMVAAAAPAVTVADTSHPYIDVFVPEGAISAVRVGASARVRVDGDATVFAGTIERIASQTEFTPRFLFSQEERPNLVIRVRVRVVDPEHRLRAGVPAFAQVQP